MKNFFRRLVRFVNDPHGRAFYSRRPVSPKEFWEALNAHIPAHPFSVGSDPKPGLRLDFTTAYGGLHSTLEWPDLLGNGLFVIFCTWVL